MVRRYDRGYLRFFIAVVKTMNYRQPGEERVYPSLKFPGHSPSSKEGKNLEADAMEEHCSLACPFVSVKQ